MNFTIRHACPGDVDAVAGLHVASWRSTYRGIFSDAFLDGEVAEERRRFWRQRLAAFPPPGQGVLVAEAEGVCVGFICINLAGDPGWGPLVENLHVEPSFKGRGIGQRLIREGAAWVREHGAFDRWHLWVLEANLPARGIYEHLGWSPVERASHHAPDGTRYLSMRYCHGLPY